MFCIKFVPSPLRLLQPDTAFFFFFFFLRKVVQTPEKLSPLLLLTLLTASMSPHMAFCEGT